MVSTANLDTILKILIKLNAKFSFSSYIIIVNFDKS